MLAASRLSEDGYVIRRFETSEEIENEPGYVQKVKKGDQRFAEFVGYYIFKDKRRCARSDCGTPHNFGYVVRTQSERTVAIGNLCGKKVFGDVFSASKRDLDAYIIRIRTEEAISAALAETSALLAQVNLLLDGSYGASWFERARASLAKACPPQAWSRFHMHVSGKDPRITITRKRDKEKDGPQLGMKRSEYVEEPVGFILGMQAFLSISPRELLDNRIRKELLEFRELTPCYIADNKPLKRRFNEWQKGIPGALASAQMTLAEARRFFATDNLKQLAHFAKNAADRELLTRLQWNDALGIVEVQSQAA